jgi:hypothetical protein
MFWRSPKLINFSNVNPIAQNGTGQAIILNSEGTHPRGYSNKISENGRKYIALSEARPTIDFENLELFAGRFYSVVLDKGYKSFLSWSKKLEVSSLGAANVQLGQL